MNASLLKQAMLDAAIDEAKKNFAFLKKNIDIDEADVGAKFAKSLDDICKAIEISSAAIDRKFPNG